ncbi:MAG: hypothetical protein AAGG57_20165 [Pseudomonadota bacterium]
MRATFPKAELIGALYPLIVAVQVITDALNLAAGIVLIHGAETGRIDNAELTATAARLFNGKRR